MVVIWERTRASEGSEWNLNFLGFFYHHFCIPRVLHDRARSPAPKGVQVHSSYASEKVLVFEVLRVRLLLSQFPEHAQIAFERRDHVIAGSCLIEILPTVSGATPPSLSNQTVLIRFFYHGVPRRDVEPVIVAQRITPWTPCAPTFRAFSNTVRKICAEDPVHPRDLLSTFCAISDPLRTSSVFLGVAMAVT